MISYFVSIDLQLIFIEIPNNIPEYRFQLIWHDMHKKFLYLNVLLDSQNDQQTKLKHILVYHALCKYMFQGYISN